jgi:Mor family transcriptional regulator
MNPESLRDIEHSLWPALIKDIAEFIGDDAALNLFVRFAGRHLIVPTRAISGHVIEQTIGRGAFVRMARNYGGDTLKIPGGHSLLIQDRNRKIAHDHYIAGVKICDLVAKYHLSDRQISKIVNTTKL